jgi:hypothetical protein
MGVLKISPELKTLEFVDRGTYSGEFKGFFKNNIDYNKNYIS